MFSLGYRTRFAGKSDFTIERDVDGVPLANEEYALNSSLFSVPFTLAWKPADWLMVSGEFQLERGSIKDQVSVYIEDPLYNTVTSSRTRSFSSGSWGVSMLMKIHRRLWIGGTYDESVDYSVEEITEYSLESLDESSSWDFSLPAAYGAGLAAGITDRWWLSGSFWSRKAPEPAGFFSQVEIIDRRPDRLKLRADLSHPGFVVVVGSYAPGWRATVSGREGKVLEANVAFRAVAAPAGRHDIELLYRPAGLGFGLAVSVGGLALLTGVFLWPSRKGRDGRPG